MSLIRLVNISEMLLSTSVEAGSSKGLTSELFNCGMLMLIDMQTHECVPSSTEG